ncbi:PRC-barrel domain-containing protein [Candidatus Berkelbacteria bacterium]|nr:PRC-barrel domain-containing protein [Candidatus Berkelbacteria bacterium]
MLIQLDALKGLPVASIDDEARIGVVSDALIHPDTGELVGFWVQPNGWLAPRRALSSSDVVSYDANAIVVRSAESLVNPAEIHAFKLLSARRDRWIGKHVVTESGERLGRVQNVVINTDLEMLAKLYVTSFLPLGTERVIARAEIVNVTQRLITVRGEGSAPAHTHTGVAEHAAA